MCIRDRAPGEDNEPGPPHANEATVPGDRPDVDALFDDLPDVPASDPGDVAGWGDDLDWGPTEPSPTDDDATGTEVDEEFAGPRRTPRHLVLTDADPFA